MPEIEAASRHFGLGLARKQAELAKKSTPYANRRIRTNRSLRRGGKALWGDDTRDHLHRSFYRDAAWNLTRDGGICDATLIRGFALWEGRSTQNFKV